MKFLKINYLIFTAKKSFNKKNYPQAVDYLRQALKLNPKRVETRFLLAETLYYNNNYEESLAEFQWYKDNWGEGPELLYYMGVCWLRLQNLELSKRLLTDAVQAFAKFPEALYALGEIALQQKDEFNARRLFSQAVDLDFELVTQKVSSL